MFPKASKAAPPVMVAPESALQRHATCQSTSAFVCTRQPLTQLDPRTCMQLPLHHVSILVVGSPSAIATDLKHLESCGHSIVYTEDPQATTRAELIAQLHAVAKSHTFSAILLLGGHGVGLLDETIWAPFLPALKCICGMGAGGRSLHCLSALQYSSSIRL